MISRSPSHSFGFQGSRWLVPLSSSSSSSSSFSSSSSSVLLVTSTSSLGWPQTSSSSSAAPAIRRCSTLKDLERTVYVHPLSQIILEYLQVTKHDWILRHQLDRLRLHRDGSFELLFPTKETGGDHHQTEHCEDGNDSTMKRNDIDLPSKARIWTSYDEMEKKHWLTVHRGTLHQRYMLQDNLQPAWHGNKPSLPERIHSAVDDMIRVIDQHLDKEGNY